MAPKARRGPAVVAIRGDDSDDADDLELFVPQARTLLVSGDGRRALATPLSPQKASASTLLPPPVYQWQPPESASNPFLTSPDIVDNEEAGGNVKEKVAAKRYPTSVC